MIPTATYVRLKDRRIRQTDTGPEKWCSTCDEWWPLEECFTRNCSMPDGYENRCKACRNSRRKKKGV